jgi:uncharacterized protein (TIGR02452 family)
MSTKLIEVAQETAGIVARGEYTSPRGERVLLRDAVKTCIEGTKLYTPQDLAEMRIPKCSGGRLYVEVTNEKTGAAAARLSELEQLPRVVALNFASAKNPGGGFLRGTKAQEEDLARCSALHASLSTKQDYYDRNREEESLLYTDHLIYSPSVPFFRDEDLQLLERPFYTSIITSPAPNAGEALKKDPSVGPRLSDALRARVNHILRVALAQGHENIVLGAWGCGVFKNDPLQVARAFSLGLSMVPGAFKRIVFAVWEKGGDGPNLRAFKQVFSQE